MQSLLGLFYSRIKGSQEDIASEGLAYILQRSATARLALSELIKTETGLEFSDLSFVTQQVGKKLERPDISGYNIDGREILILEAKFWAALTANQPLEYLNRLENNSALIFICPSLRVISIYDELCRKLRNHAVPFAAKPETFSLVLDNNKYLMVKKWDEVLFTIRQYLVQQNEQGLLSDLNQIIGLCNTIDSNAFLPLQQEDFAPATARRITSYYDLTDKVADELVKRGLANTKGLKTTPRRYGYARYLNMGNYGLAISLKFHYWAKHAETPFWLTIKEVVGKDWVLTNQLRLAGKKAASQLNFTYFERENGDRLLSFALFPVLGQTEDLVIKDLVDQIISLTKGIQSNLEWH